MDYSNLKWVCYTVVQRLVGTEFLVMAKILRSIKKSEFLATGIRNFFWCSLKNVGDTDYELWPLCISANAINSFLTRCTQTFHPQIDLVCFLPWTLLLVRFLLEFMLLPALRHTLFGTYLHTRTLPVRHFGFPTSSFTQNVLVFLMNMWFYWLWTGDVSRAEAFLKETATEINGQHLHKPKVDQTDDIPPFSFLEWGGMGRAVLSGIYWNHPCQSFVLHSQLHSKVVCKSCASYAIFRLFSPASFRAGHKQCADCRGTATLHNSETWNLIAKCRKIVSNVNKWDTRGFWSTRLLHTTLWYCNFTNFRCVKISVASVRRGFGFVKISVSTMLSWSLSVFFSLWCRFNFGKTKDHRKLNYTENVLKLQYVTQRWEPEKEYLYK